MLSASFSFAFCSDERHGAGEVLMGWFLTQAAPLQPAREERGGFERHSFLGGIFFIFLQSKAALLGRAEAEDKTLGRC